MASKRALGKWRARAKRMMNLHPPPLASNACRWAALAQKGNIMPKITVEIWWDMPDDPFWLNPDNVATALHAYCRNTRFIVKSAKQRLAGDGNTVMKAEESDDTRHAPEA
jgi:hypothetical protein